MAYRRDPDTLYPQDDGTLKDEYDSIYNENGFLIYDNSPQAQSERRASQEEFEARRAQEKQWAMEAMRNAGGFSFLNPLNWFSSRSSGNWLGGVFSGLAGNLIGIWCIIFLIVMVYCILIDPIVQAIGRGISTVKMFFISLFAGIRAGLHFIWQRILWFILSWVMTVIDILRGVPGAGFFGNLIFRILALAEIALIIAYLVFLVRKFKRSERFPVMIKSDVLEPTAIILVFEAVKWLLFPAVLNENLLGMLYNVLCMSVWVVIAELVIIAVFRKRMRIW